MQWALDFNHDHPGDCVAEPARMPALQRGGDPSVTLERGRRANFNCGDCVAVASGPLALHSCAPRCPGQRAAGAGIDTPSRLRPTHVALRPTTSICPCTISPNGRVCPVVGHNTATPRTKARWCVHRRPTFRPSPGPAGMPALHYGGFSYFEALFGIGVVGGWGRRLRRRGQRAAGAP